MQYHNMYLYSSLKGKYIYNIYTWHVRVLPQGNTLIFSFVRTLIEGKYTRIWLEEKREEMYTYMIKMEIKLHLIRIVSCLYFVLWCICEINNTSSHDCHKQNSWQCVTSCLFILVGNLNYNIRCSYYTNPWFLHVFFLK